jgi:hypothetical protein
MMNKEERAALGKRLAAATDANEMDAGKHAVNIMHFEKGRPKVAEGGIGGHEV